MKKFANLYLALVFVIIYLPIFYLIAFSFNSGGDMNSFTGFTLDNYQSMFSDSRLMLILVQTFFLAFLSALLATIIGTFGSIFIYESKQKQQTGILSLNNVLMVAPDVMIGASFLILFTWIGFQLGFVSVLLSHIAFSIPIVVLMVLPRLKEMYSRARKGISLEINALSTVVFLFSILLVIGYYMITQERKEEHDA